MTMDYNGGINIEMRPREKDEKLEINCIAVVLKK
jgi:hypothetical protein